ncbi:MAG: hypothetical protein E3J86_09800 [Candidatus Thorarchaeota archaeon]|nr:MAG: hypothetical protein E3J86_09800 [Candidatus Thorarchaeota archaeon]
MGPAHVDEPDIELQLTGRTLRVYWFLLKEKKPADRKSVQRGANLSTPSLAEYHLRKLMDLGLVNKLAHGDYFVTKTVRVGVTRFYFKFRNSLVPRFALYSSFYLIILIFSFLVLRNMTGDVAFLILSVVIFGLVTSIFELLTLIRSTP